MKVYASISTNNGRAEIRDMEDGTWAVVVDKDGQPSVEQFNSLEAANAYANEIVK